MMALGQSKFIHGEQHHLYEIVDDDDWSQFAWMFHHEGNQYWVPVKDKFTLEWKESKK